MNINILKTPLILISLLCHLVSFAQLIPRDDSYLLSLSGGSVADPNVGSVVVNPAMLGKMDSFRAEASYVSRFGIREMGLSNLGLFVSDAKQHQYGLQIATFGYERYNASKFSANYALQLFEHLRLGLSMNYFYVSIPEIQNSDAFTADIGLFYALSEYLFMGMSLENPLQSSLKGPDLFQNIESAMQWGILWQASKVLSTNADLRLPLKGGKPDIRGAFRIQAHRILMISAGLGTYPFRNTLGLHLSSRHFNLRLAYEYANSLGHSPGVALEFSL